MGGANPQESVLFGIVSTRYNLGGTLRGGGTNPWTRFWVLEVSLEHSAVQLFVVFKAEL